MGEARRRKAAGQYPDRASQNSIDRENIERAGRELKMPDDFMRQMRAILAPDGPDYNALAAAGGDPKMAFEAIALAESVSTDGYIDREKWEALMRKMGLRDAIT